MPRFGQLRVRIREYLKEMKGRGPFTLSIVRKQAQNAKRQERYKNRKKIPEQWVLRLLHSRTETIITPKPQLQMEKIRMFWNPNI